MSKLPDKIASSLKSIEDILSAIQNASRIFKLTTPHYKKLEAIFALLIFINNPEVKPVESGEITLTQTDGATTTLRPSKETVRFIASCQKEKNRYKFKISENHLTLIKALNDFLTQCQMNEGDKGKEINGYVSDQLKNSLLGIKKYLKTLNLTPEGIASKETGAIIAELHPSDDDSRNNNPLVLSINHFSLFPTSEQDNQIPPISGGGKAVMPSSTGR